MNEEEKKAIKLLEEYLNFGNKEGVLYINLRTIFTIIEKQQNLIDKQNKVIDEMVKDIYDSQMECNRYFKDKEEVKQYFIRKVEKDE